MRWALHHGKRVGFWSRRFISSRAGILAFGVLFVRFGFFLFGAVAFGFWLLAFGFWGVCGWMTSRERA